jgi:hypothetical protein
MFQVKIVFTGFIGSMLFSNILLGQITSVDLKRVQIGIVRYYSNMDAELAYEVVNSDTTYILTYRKYISYGDTNVVSKIYFTNKYNELKELYKIFRGAFTAPKSKQYSKLVTLNGFSFNVHGARNLGGKCVHIQTEDGSSTNFSEAQIQKLFGREYYDFKED